MTSKIKSKIKYDLAFILPVGDGRFNYKVISPAVLSNSGDWKSSIPGMAGVYNVFVKKDFTELIKSGEFLVSEPNDRGRVLIIIDKFGVLSDTEKGYLESLKKENVVLRENVERLKNELVLSESKRLAITNFSKARKDKAKEDKTIEKDNSFNKNKFESRG